jgi:carboxyl-terminal processing protease
VYGKGGITPDYFIALDTTGFSRNTASIYEKNTINNFAYNFYLENLPRLKVYKTPNEYINGFVFTDADWNRFVQSASKDSVNISAPAPKEKADLVNRIRSAVARQLWRNEGFYEVLNTADPAINKALEVLK